MSEHVGYVVRVSELKDHPNADRLKVATFFGNDTCVGIDTAIGEIGIYFPCDLQLSEEFCDANHLCRKTADGKPDTGYLEREKRNVRAIKLRGVKSDGIFMSLSCLEYTGVNFDDINIGDTISVVNGHEICKKYIPRGTKQNLQGHPNEGNRTRKRHDPIAPLLAEHADTEQLAYNLGAFKPGDLIEITLKMHGTSQRTGYLPMLHGYTGPNWAHIVTKHPKLFKRLQGKANATLSPIYDYGYVSGTRRTVLNDWEGGFYGSNEFRKKHAEFFEGKLHKGEEVFYEVVGFTDNGTPIMGDCQNKKLNDKEFVKQYGEITRFSYGCSPNGANELPQSDFYVYRMTMTNEDGDVVEYSPDFMRYRCEQMGCKCVPVMWKGYIPADETLEECYDCNGEWGAWRVIRKSTPGEWIKNIAEQYYDGPDPIGKSHVREGVVIRIINRPKFCAYKHKNFNFKCLEGIVKNEETAPDMEEAEDVNNEN